jgi:hypothetical protein
MLCIVTDAYTTALLSVLPVMICMYAAVKSEIGVIIYCIHTVARCNCSLDACTVMLMITV